MNTSNTQYTLSRQPKVVCLALAAPIRQPGIAHRPGPAQMRFAPSRARPPSPQ